MTEQVNNPVIDPKSFEAIANLAYNESGLQLVVEKTSMIQSRLRHRLRALDVKNFEQYATFVCSPEGVSERRQMISALTTNVSHFFREQHHFDILVKKTIPGIIDKVRQGGRLRIWSAGCSNGQEAYSIAMTIAEHFPEVMEMDFKILATDIDPKVVEFASCGEYPERLVSGVPDTLLKRYFSKSDGGEGLTFLASENLKQRIYFKELNLLSDWPIKQQFDVIFCRNVVIYFDLETQNKLWPRYRDVLTHDGYLFLGHSERIADLDQAGFLSDGPTSYRPINNFNS
ncbi:MAG: protein-glutamate O-methyltransferase [Lentilitoribacter sp.]